MGAIFVGLLLFVLNCHISNAAELLLAVMNQGRSHAQSFTPLMHELQKHNNTVTLTMSTYVPEIPFGLQEAFFNLSELGNPLDSPQFSEGMWRTDFTFLMQIVPFYQGTQSCSYIMENRKEQFDKLVNGNWSLILTDSLFSSCGYAIASLNKAHHVMMHSSDVESAHGVFKAFQRNYGLLPMNFMSSTNAKFDPNVFWDRVRSSYDWFGSIFGTGFISSNIMSMAFREILPQFTFRDYVRTSSFTFTDMPESLYPAAPRTNDYFSYGSYCRPAVDLNSEWKSFVEDKESKGTILVAFGTIVNWSRAPKEYLESFVKTLNGLTEYRIIWSFKGAPLDVKSHIRIGAWIPQNDILLHNKTVLFISHGGLKSVKEAACAGIPSLFMPMFAEQTRNGWLAKHKGFAEILSKYRLSEEGYIETAIRNILEHDSYRNAGRMLKSEFLDAPMSTLKKAVFLFKRLLKYDGRFPDFFYSKGLDQWHFTLFNLDLVLILPLSVLYVLC